MPDLPVSIRSATQSDEATIKQMIREARLDPTSLKWQNFLIAEYEGEIAGIGQIKKLPGCEELGSLVTKRKYRGQGVGGKLITELESRAGRPLYLLCAQHNESYYKRFNYRTISWWEAPAFLKLKVAPALPLRLFGLRVVIMRKI